MIKIISVSLLTQTPQLLYRAEKKTRLYYRGPILSLGGDNTVPVSSAFSTNEIFPTIDSAFEMDEGDELWCNGSPSSSLANLLVVD